MSTISDAYVAIIADGSKFVPGVAAMAEEASSKAGATISASMGDRMGDIGSTLTKTLTPAAGAVTAFALKAGGDWREMSKEIAVQTGATGERLKDLQDSVKDVAGSVAGNVGEIGNVVSDLAAKTSLTGKPLEDLARNVLALNDVGIQISGSQVAATFGAWGVEAGKFDENLTRMLRTSQASGQPMGVLMERLAEFRPRLQALGFDLNTSELLVSRVTDAMSPGLAKAVGTVAKAQGDLAGNQRDARKAQEEYTAAVKKHGAGSDEAAKAAEKLKEAQLAVALGGKSASDAFRFMTDNVKGAKSEQEALSLAVDYFGTKAAPAWLSAIRSGKLDLGELEKKVAENTSTAQKMSREYEGLGGTISRWKDGLIATAGPLAQQAAGIGTFLTSVGPLASGVGKATKLIVGHFKTVGPAADAMAPAVGKAAEKMGPMVGKGAAKMGPAVMGAMKGIGPAISGGFAALAPLLGAAMPWILIVAGIALAAVAIFAFFKSDLPKKIWEALKDAGSWLLEMGGKILQGLWDGVLSKVVAFYKFFYWDLPKAILEAFMDAGKWLLEKGGDILQGLWDGVLSKVAAFYKFLFWDIPKAIVGFFSDAGKWLVDAGKEIIMGLARGLGDAVEWVLAAARAVVDKVKGVLMFWSSPPEAFGRKLGAGLMGGLADGMNTGADASARAAAAAVARTRAAMAMAATPVNLSAAVRGAIGGAGAGGAAPTTVNLDLRGATVGVDDLVDQVAAGLAKRDRRTGAALT